MPYFIKSGYWKKASKTYEGWLNLDNLQHPIIESGFSTLLTFNKDKDIYYDATGEDLQFSINESNNINGAGIYLRLNKPSSVTFPANFEPDPNSESVDDTKLNFYILVYFNNWDGNGSEKVIFYNKTFNAI